MKRAECALVIAIVGAESSGKTTLARALQARLAGIGLRAALVDETLRTSCDRARRTPRPDEQAAIVAAHSERIADTTQGHDVVVADTTALMTAVYSEYLFGDTSLHAAAAAAHRRSDLTLLTALDLPWRADGPQCHGAHVREPIDALVRAALERMGAPYCVVAGRGEARLESAWRAVQRAFPSAPARAEGDAHNPPAPRWHCERCGDAACERRLLLSSLLAREAT